MRKGPVPREAGLVGQGFILYNKIMTKTYKGKDKTVSSNDRRIMMKNKQIYDELV